MTPVFTGNDVVFRPRSYLTEHFYDHLYIADAILCKFFFDRRAHVYRQSGTRAIVQVTSRYSERGYRLIVSEA